MTFRTTVDARRRTRGSRLAAAALGVLALVAALLGPATLGPAPAMGGA